MEQFCQDLRHAIRGFLRSPGFTFLAVLALALGIGVNTTLFSLYDAVALKPMPVTDPDHVVRFERWLESHSLGQTQYGFSYPEYVYCRDHNDQFSSLVAASWIVPVDASASGAGSPEQRAGQLVSTNYFADLGIPLLKGRGFLPDEDRTPGLNNVVVVSYGYWQNRLARRPTGAGPRG
jgi:hypothetical protein